jgi:GntR family histidine utilization transcriptional repressor
MIDITAGLLTVGHTWSARLEMDNLARNLKAIAGDDPSLPLYERIRRYILKGIGSGAWPDGVRIPSEHELVDLFGVSRMTVNRALRELTAEGVLVRVQGVGTFVAKLTKAQSTLLKTQDISEEIKLRGHRHSCRILTLQKRKPSTEILEKLELPANSTVFHSVIVHYENDVPVQLEERFVNSVIAPHYLKQDFTTITTHRYLVDCATITEIEHIVHAVMPDEHESKLLKSRPNEPCLLLLRRTWSGRTAATFSRFIYPGDRYALGGRFKAIDGIIATEGQFTLAAQRPG